MHKFINNRKPQLREKRSLTSKIKLKLIRASLSVVKKFGLSGFFLRLAWGLSERPPCFYDIYRRGERLVEYAWILRNLNIEKGRILDVGCCGTLFSIMLASFGYEVVGVDVKDYNFKHPNFKFIKGDLLEPATMKKLGEEKFDIVTIISTLEHVGIELRAENAIDLNADVRLLSMLKAHLNPDGVILITTEYGKSKVIKRPIDPSVDPPSYPYKITPWLKLYDEKEIGKLLEKASLEILNKEYFAEKEGYWVPASNAEINNIDYPELGCKGIKSIVCLKLKKRTEKWA